MLQCFNHVVPFQCFVLGYPIQEVLSKSLALRLGLPISVQHRKFRVQQPFLIFVCRHFGRVDGVPPSLEEHVHDDGAAVDIDRFGVGIAVEYFGSHEYEGTALEGDGARELGVELGAESKVSDLEAGEVVWVGHEYVF